MNRKIDKPLRSNSFILALASYVKTILKKYRTVIVVYTVGFFALGIFFAVISLPSVFWNVRPVWLNVEELKSWAQQSEPLSQSQLRLIQKVIDENYNSEGRTGSYALDAMCAHMHHQEKDIVDMFEYFVKHTPIAKEASLFQLAKVSPKYESKAITVFQDQLLNDNHGNRRSTIICFSIDGLSKLDLAGSRDIMQRFVNDPDDSIALHASFKLGLFDDLSQ